MSRPFSRWRIGLELTIIPALGWQLGPNAGRSVWKLFTPDQIPSDGILTGMGILVLAVIVLIVEVVVGGNQMKAALKFNYEPMSCFHRDIKTTPKQIRLSTPQSIRGEIPPGATLVSSSVPIMGYTDKTYLATYVLLKIINKRRVTAEDCEIVIRKIEYRNDEGHLETIWSGTQQLSWSPSSEIGHRKINIAGLDDHLADIVSFPDKKPFRIAIKTLSSEWVDKLDRIGIYYFTIMATSKGQSKVVGKFGMNWNGNSENMRPANVWIE